jgi:hypothetical protein
VRAKNSTRQVEHLQQCNEFLQSADGAQAQADGLLDLSPADGPNLNRPDIFRGTAPNNNFQLHRQRSRGKGSFQQQSQRPNQTPTQPKPSPSLVNHLLAKNSDSLSKATQQQFLSHAGCGTLSAPALQEWLTQQIHMSRYLVTFIGNVIGKIRLTDARNPLQDTNWRTLDLLVSCINNAKRELEFLRSTGHKYGLQSDGEGPKPASKALIDLFAASSGSSASLLEAIVVLWSIQHVSRPFIPFLAVHQLTSALASLCIMAIRRYLCPSSTAQSNIILSTVIPPTRLLRYRQPLRPGAINKRCLGKLSQRRTTRSTNPKLDLERLRQVRRRL